jgi:sulfate adenylyltransferase
MSSPLKPVPGAAAPAWEGSIAPHGGELVSRFASFEEEREWRARAPSLERIRLNARELSDLEMIAVGAFSPLRGFMTRADYERVVGEMRLASGLVWSIPVTLAVKEENAPRFREGHDIGLTTPAGELVGILHLKEKWKPDQRREARLVYRTEEEAHPGVRALYEMGPVYLGGEVTVLGPFPVRDFAAYRLTPAQTRHEFHKRGWKRIVAFQTRNPIHRAHEYIQKCALESVDGLLLHPLVGETKGDDIPAQVRMRCYEVILEHYYPRARVLLAVFGANMRYAGPREAIFHAIARKNFGCTHFIVGRDHAGVGSYYGTYDAQRIFDEIEPQALGIEPMFFEHTYWCRRCEGMASPKTCPHPEADRLSLSGSKVRELLRSGQLPPQEFTRREVAEVLAGAMRAG